VKLLKVLKAYRLFKELIEYYAVTELLANDNYKNIIGTGPTSLTQSVPAEREQWINVGGQLVPSSQLQGLITQIKGGSINDWEALHEQYTLLGNNYPMQKLQHAISSLNEASGINLFTANEETIRQLFEKAINTKRWMVKGIYASREKDYTSAFRKMMYDTQEEMDAVVGKLEDNSFITQQNEELQKFEQAVKAITNKLARPVLA
jgi:hypothetical protein